MSETEDIFDIVDEDGNPTGGTIRRDDAHSLGILHRTVHLHFYDKDGYMYFQKRSHTRKHFPGMLHFAAGGHVKAGQSIVDAVLEEAKEEIGILISEKNIELIGKFHLHSIHPEYTLDDNEIAFDYAYLFDGNMSLFDFTDGEVENIEKRHLDTMYHLPYEEYKNNNIVPYTYYPEIFRWIKKKIELLH